jgi:histidine triad (HIT) family protein
MSADCIFCAIAAGTIPADIVAEGDEFIAFRDIAPKAPVHLVVIPRRHVASLAHAAELPESVRAVMTVFVAEVADAAGLSESGYRVVTNHGPDSRQSVFHLHWHVLGGVLLSDAM